MKKISLFFLVFIALLCSCSALTEGKQKMDELSKEFHDNFNAQKIDEIYSKSSQEFQNNTSKDKLTELLSAVHRKLGNYKESKFTGFQVKSYNLKNYLNFSLESTFENGSGTETFLYMEVKGEYVLQNYNIQSMDLITK